VVRCIDTALSDQHGGRARRSEQQSKCETDVSEGESGWITQWRRYLTPARALLPFLTAFFRVLVVGMRTRPTDQREGPVAALELPHFVIAAGGAVVVVRRLVP
jgi:hypothetical protein